jgi:hypothetical protein
MMSASRSLRCSVLHTSRPPPIVTVCAFVDWRRFNGRHLASISSKITFTTALPSKTAAAGARQRIDGCGEAAMYANDRRLVLLYRTAATNDRARTGVRDARTSSRSSGGETSSSGLRRERLCNGGRNWRSTAYNSKARLAIACPITSRRCRVSAARHSRRRTRGASDISAST